MAGWPDCVVQAGSLGTRIKKIRKLFAAFFEAQRKRQKEMLAKSKCDSLRMK
jgi:hypothetical protein